MTNSNDIKKDVKNKADELYKEGKEKVSHAYHEAKDKTESMAHQFTEGVSHLYEESKQKVHNLEDCMGEYSDEIIKTIKDKPLTSVLIAGGIGFLLSRLLKK